jgi:outer membrane biosynthesis protein TonB
MALAKKRRRSEIVDTINAALEIVDEVAQDGDGDSVRAVIADFALKQISEATYEDDDEDEDQALAEEEEEPEAQEEEEPEAEEEDEPEEEEEEEPEEEPEPPKRTRGRSSSSKSSVTGSRSSRAKR